MTDASVQTAAPEQDRGNSPFSSLKVVALAAIGLVLPACEKELKSQVSEPSSALSEKGRTESVSTESAVPGAKLFNESDQRKQVQGIFAVVPYVTATEPHTLKQGESVEELIRSRLREAREQPHQPPLLTDKSQEDLAFASYVKVMQTVKGIDMRRPARVGEQVQLPTEEAAGIIAFSHRHPDSVFGVVIAHLVTRKESDASQQSPKRHAIRMVGPDGKLHGGKTTVEQGQLRLKQGS